MAHKIIAVINTQDIEDISTLKYIVDFVYAYVKDVQVTNNVQNYLNSGTLGDQSGIYNLVLYINDTTNRIILGVWHAKSFESHNIDSDIDAENVDHFIDIIKSSTFFLSDLNQKRLGLHTVIAILDNAHFVTGNQILEIIQDVKNCFKDIRVTPGAYELAEKLNAKTFKYDTKLVVYLDKNTNLIYLGAWYNLSAYNQDHIKSCETNNRTIFLDRVKKYSDIHINLNRKNNANRLQDQKSSNIGTDRPKGSIIKNRRVRATIAIGQASDKESDSRSETSIRE